MTNRLDLLAPAKINLFLELKSKRDDGFHELETVMSCVNLCDRLSFEVRDDAQIQLRLANDADGLPDTDGNLITQALHLLKSETRFGGGMTVDLEKRIPVQAGLGGASSDAAAALCAGNQLWNLGLSKSRLFELAAQLGSDVPFFVTGGAAVCTGRGEVVSPVTNICSYPILIAKPPVGLSTPKVFSHCKVPDNPTTSNDLIKAMHSGNKSAIRDNFLNRLEPAAEQVTDWIGRMRGAFQEVNCLAHQLSGSGSCYFGLFSNSKLLRKGCAKLLQREPEIALYCCKATGRLAHQFLGME